MLSKFAAWLQINLSDNISYIEENQMKSIRIVVEDNGKESVGHHSKKCSNRQGASL